MGGVLGDRLVCYTTIIDGHDGLTLLGVELDARRA